MKKETLLAFKERVTKLGHSKQVIEKLQVLPHVQQVDFEEAFKQKIAKFENKNGNVDISFEEALVTSEALQPVLQGVNEGKLEFIQRVCNDPQYQRKTR